MIKLAVLILGINEQLAIISTESMRLDNKRGLGGFLNTAVGMGVIKTIFGQALR